MTSLFFSDFLMTVGGWRNGNSYLDTVELKSLSPDAPLPECLTSPRGNFPTKLRGAVGISLGESASSDGVETAPNLIDRYCQ